MHRGWSCFCAWFEVCWDVQSKSCKNYSRNFYQNWQNLQNTWVGAIIRFLVSRSTQTIYRNSAFIMVTSRCWKERDSNFQSLHLIIVFLFLNPYQKWRYRTIWSLTSLCYRSAQNRRSSQSQLWTRTRPVFNYIFNLRGYRSILPLKLSKIIRALKTIGQKSWKLMLAIHQAIGFNFLGACQYSLSSDKISLATLFISLIPKYPTGVDENHQIVQTQRHLAVLAARKRLLGKA